MLLYFLHLVNKNYAYFTIYFIFFMPYKLFLNNHKSACSNKSQSDFIFYPEKY